MYIQSKNIVTSVLLSVVTCGIYSIFWLYTIIDDVYTLTNNGGNAGTDIILSIITCGIYGIYMWYKLGDLLSTYRYENNLSPKNNSILYLVLSLFGLALVNFCIIQSELNTYAVDVIQ